MPSGAKKRKAAKKKQVSTTTPHQGENDGNSLDPIVEVVEKREDSSSENKSKDANVEIEIGSKSKSSNGSSSSSSDSSDDESKVVEKKVVVVESAPVDSVPVIESLPEKISPIVEPVKNVDSLLEEVSQVFDEISNGDKKDLIVEETLAPVVVEEQTVDVSEIGLKDDLPTSSGVVEAVLKEPSLDEKASMECVAASTPPKDSISEVNGADCANEVDTTGHPDGQAPVASTPLAVQKTTWKSCCGIFELFSGSGR